MKPARVEETKD